MTAAPVKWVIALLFCLYIADFCKATIPMYPKHFHKTSFVIICQISGRQKAMCANCFHFTLNCSSLCNLKDLLRIYEKDCRLKAMPQELLKCFDSL